MNLEDSEIKEFKIFAEGVATDEGTSSSTIIQRPENNTRIFERRIFENIEFIEAKNGYNYRDNFKVKKPIKTKTLTNGLFLDLDCEASITDTLTRWGKKHDYIFRKSSGMG